MLSGRVALMALAATLLAGCGSVPSYYSDRVSGQGASASNYAAAPAVREDAPRARRVQRAQRAQPAPAVSASALSAPQPQPAPEAENTGTTEDEAPRAAPTANADDAAARERAERRDRSISRSINSICRGC